MSIINNTTEKRKFQQFTYTKRQQLEVLLKVKSHNKSEIAEILGKTERSINREILRGTVEQMNSDLSMRTEYSADKANQRAIELASNKGKGIKLGKDHKLANHIESKIKKEKYSPEAIIGEINSTGLKFEVTICSKTIYNYIDKGIFLEITNRDLPVKKNKKKRNYKKIRLAYNNLKGTSIEERPTHIENREEYGHWEMDCVVGNKKGGSAVLLVLTERMTRQEIIRKISSKKQESVINELNKLEKKYGKKFKKIFKTITTDNGVEFLNFKGMEASELEVGNTRTKVYYAHPFSSYERGSNENANKLIRRFLPKGTDINKISNKEIKKIEDWINNYPRRIFNYKTSNDLLKLLA